MPRLRTFLPQFRLRTLLASLTVLCALLGVRSSQIARERRALDRLRAAAGESDSLHPGAGAWHEYRDRHDFLKWTRRNPSGSAWHPADSLAQLVYYHVVGVNLAGDGLNDSSLVDLQELPRLQWLKISDAPRITDNCIPTLCALDGLQRLELLETAVTRQGAAELERALPACQIKWEPQKQLPAISEHLHRSNSFRARRLGSKVPVWNYKGLRSITMRGPTIDDVALAALSDPGTIGSLTITEAPNVTDAGLKHLRGASNLDELMLHRTAVTAEGVAKLQQALPDCEITRRPPRPARERWPWGKPSLMSRILNAFDPASDW